MACGVLSSLVVLFSLYLYFQRREGDPFFASDEYRLFQEGQAVKNLRRGIAEEFATAVVNCISPPIVPGSVLTEQEETARVTAAIGSYSAAAEKASDQKCKDARSTHWSFEAPCTLRISKTFSKSSGGLNLGEMDLCMQTIALAIRSSVGKCTSSGDFPGCLISSIVANDNVKREIEKPVEAQAARAR